MSDLVIVVVNYFSSNRVSALIRQIHEQASLPGFHIICTDNSCDLAEANRLRQVQDEFGCSLLINTENLGYGAAVNQALSDCDQFQRALILNPDLSLEQDAISQLYQFSLQQPELGIWGGITINPSAQPDFRHAWRGPTILRELSWSLGARSWLKSSLFSDDYRRAHRSVAYAVDAISGCCMLISRDAWQTLSGFDERFFLYSEEIDLCYRARKLGYSPTVVPAVRLKHDAHNAVDALKKLEMIFTGKIIFAEKHFLPISAFLYRYSLFLGAAFRSVFYGAKSTNRTQAKAWQKVACDLFFNRKAY